MQERVPGSVRALARAQGLALAWFPGLDQVSAQARVLAQVLARVLAQVLAQVVTAPEAGLP